MQDQYNIIGFSQNESNRNAVDKEKIDLQNTDDGNAKIIEV